MSDGALGANLCPSNSLSFSLSLHPSSRLGSIRDRMRLPFMNDQCEQMLKICKEFVRLQVSYEEYLCMKVLLLLSTGTCAAHMHVYLDSNTAVHFPLLHEPAPASPPF